MSDLKLRFRKVDGIEPPDLWPGIEAWTPGRLPPATAPSVRHRVMVAVVALIVAAIPITVVALNLSGSEKPPGSSSTPTLGPPIAPSYLQERPVLEVVPRTDPRFASIPVSCTNQATLDRCIGRLPTTSEVVLQIPFGKFVLGPVIVDASNLVSATAVPDPKGTDWGVKLQFDAEGTQRLAAATAVATSEPSPLNQIANIIEGHIISSRVPEGKITDGEWFIFSDLYQGKAEQLAARLNAGVLPTPGANA